MASLLKNLEQRFSTTRYLRGSESTDLIRPGGNAREWIVARGLCLYALIDCSSVPAKKRHGFVEISVRRLAPFADPECHVVWTSSAAMVWIWPRSRMMPDEEGVPLRTDEDTVLPESIFLGQPLEEGTELQQDSSGFEGRIWRQATLLASRWWQSPPGLEEWGAFCRGSGLAAPSVVPEAAPFMLQDRPWADQRERTAKAWMQQLKTPATIAALFLLAAALAWQLGGIGRLAWARSTVARDTSQLNTQLGAILTARDQAIRDAAAADQLLSLRPPRDQISLMARMAELLGDRHAQVVEWAVPEPGKLAITLRIANPNPEALVRLVEGSGLLTAVTSDSASAGEIVLRGNIVRGHDAGGAP